MVDLVAMDAKVWPADDDSEGAKFEVQPIPEHMVAEAEQARAELLEVVAGADDDVMEKYLGDEELSVDEVKRALRTGTIKGEFVPVLCGSAFKNKGVQPMLDAVVDFLPSPVDIPPTQGLDMKGIEELEREADDKAPFSALAFKIVADPYGQAHLLPRLLGHASRRARRSSTRPRTARSASVASCACTPTTAKTSRPRTRATSSRGSASRTRPPATRCATAPRRSCSRRWTSRSPSSPSPSSPRRRSTRTSSARRLSSLSDEDPTFQVHTDEETGQTIIAGMGELHLDVLVDRMMREFAVAANVGKPQVAYRETVLNSVEKIEERYIRQTGGKGQYGHVVISLEPTGPGGGYEFVDKITGGVIPREYIPSVNAGIQEAMEGGVLAGYPLVDIRITLTYGSYHDVDSSEMAFRIAGSMAFKKAARAAKPVLLEPIMAVEVVTPEDYMGDVIGDLSSRRGRVEGMEQRGTSHVVRAQVPLGEMFGYATDLRSRTQGRATYTMQFDSYQQVPESIAEEIVKRVRGE